MLKAPAVCGTEQRQLTRGHVDRNVSMDRGAPMDAALIVLLETGAVGMGDHHGRPALVNEIR